MWLVKEIKGKISMVLYFLFYTENALVMNWGQYLMFYVFEVAYLHKSKRLVYLLKVKYSLFL